MIPDFQEPLPREERDALFTSTAQFVARRGLQTPAILALEMHKPLGNIAGHGLVLVAPLLGPLLGIDRMQKLARVLMEPDAIEELIRKIEETDIMTEKPAKEQTA